MFIQDIRRKTLGQKPAVQEEIHVQNLTENTL